LQSGQRIAVPVTSPPHSISDCWSRQIASPPPPRISAHESLRPSYVASAGTGRLWR
jgi:hypothetical protein